MHFEDTPDEGEFRLELRGWLEENLPDGWIEGDRRVLRDRDGREQFLRDWQRKLYDGGWAGLHWPEEYGGRGGTLMEQLIYEEETSRVDAPPVLNAVGLWFVGPTLIEVGTEEQKQRFLPQILTGEEIWCQGYSEPNAGSDLASLQTRAVDEGDRFVVDGQKIWTTHAHLADWCLLLTRTDTSGPKYHGITVLLVEMDQPGMTTEPIRQINGEAEFNHVYFDGAVAEKEHVLGAVDGGWDVAMTLSAFEHGNTNIFDVERRWEEVVAFCREHERDGMPFSEHRQVRRELAEFATRIQATKLTHLRNASRQMHSGVPGPERSMDKILSRELAKELESFAQRLLGGRGSLWEDGFADGRWLEEYFTSFGRTISGGTVAIQRNIIAERVLGLPKDPKQ